jgi:hypothetical protein
LQAQDPKTQELFASGYEIVRGECSTGKKYFATQSELCESLRNEKGNDCEPATLSLRATHQCDPEAMEWQSRQEGVFISYNAPNDLDPDLDLHSTLALEKGIPTGYRIQTADCTTGDKVFESEKDFCESLQSSSANNSCARDDREKLWLKECGSEFRETS